MTVTIPLPWYSSKIYDINTDSISSGWRILIIRIERLHLFGAACGFKVSMILGCRFTQTWIKPLGGDGHG